MEFWGSDELIDSTILNRGDTYVFGGLGVASGKQLESISIDVKGTGIKYRIGLYYGSGSSTDDWDGSTKTLIEDFGEQTSDDLVGYNTFLSSSNPELPDGQDLWIIVTVDASENLPSKGATLPNGDLITVLHNVSGSDSSATPFEAVSTMSIWNNVSTAQSVYITYSDIPVAEPKIITDGVDNPKIVDRAGTLLTGLYNYTVLDGADIATSTYVASGTTSISSGVTAIKINGGTQNIGDNMIVMLQDTDNKIVCGAYEMTITEISI